MKNTLVLLFLITTISNILSQYQQIETIDKLFEQYNENTPGCAVGVVQNGEIIFQKGYGSACLNYSIQNNPSTKFLIGSLTKQFTGACIAMLIAENKLKLDDDIRKYIPEFPFYGDTIKISNLLFHTSGIKNYEIAMGMSGIGFDELYKDYNHLLNLIYSQSTLVFKPNTKYAYSNSNYTLLGEIVFRITGHKLEEFAERKIFQPLNMHHTSYWISPNEVIKNRATGYSYLGHGEYEINQPLWIPYGSGNMISNITDLSKWSSFLIEQYQEQTEFIKVFTQMGYTSNGKPTNYASGIKLSKYRGLRKFEHGGGLHGFRSRITIFPDNNLSIIVLGNIDNLWTYSATCLLADYFLKKDFSKGKDYTIPSNYQITAKCDDIIT
ncbi:MAG: beta-lactamase family protein, partial [Bacteroidales bacterium]|nr:beta-lactamase family protein [Bacteroidales bacterium]